MKDLLSKEHYSCKIHKLIINEKQCFTSLFMIFQNYQLPYNSLIHAYSKNNVIFFYKQKIPIYPFVQPPFDILPLIAYFGEVLSLLLTQGMR